VQVRRIAIAALLLPFVAAAAGVSIQFHDGVFKVAGWNPGAEPVGGWSSIFNVYSEGDSVWIDRPPVFGSYSVDNGQLTFRPRFPPSEGVSYRAIFHLPGEEPVEARFGGITLAPSLTITRIALTHVAAVYPSGDILPSNQLKFYVYFSASMQRGAIWPKIHLLDESGKALVLPFLELDQELWDPSLQRLTVLFDPGRIKRGVTPNVEMGQALVEGKRYALVIDRELKDGHGFPLEQTFRKEFTVGPAERRAIDPKQWKIATPRQGSRDPLVIDFGRPLDYALLQHVFEIMDRSGAVGGSKSVTHEENQWTFQPTNAWKSGDYKLTINMALEDLAGNRIGRPFDVDTIDSPAERISKQTTTLSFRVR
jgi:hypothetical protein